MKKIILCLSLFLSVFGYSQLSGDIVVDGREIVSDISYSKEMHREGVLVFDISVNTDGKVSACDINKIETTFYSERYFYEAKNLILNDLKFERGNGFPTFHRGKVTITAIVK